MRKLYLLLSLALVSSALAASTKTVLLVEGMTCASCAGAIEKRLKKVEGVRSVDIAIKAGKVTVTSKENAAIDPAKAKSAIEEAGYKVITIESSK